jgi:hypothetical protein
MKLQNLLSILPLLLLVTSSCTIHKRHYSKGYFISWNKAYKSEQSAEQDKPHEQITSKTVDVEVIELEKTEDLQVLDFTHQTVNNEIATSTPTLQSINEVRQNTKSIKSRAQSEKEKLNRGALNGAILSSVGWIAIILSVFILPNFLPLLAIACFFIAILSSLTSIKKVRTSQNKRDRQLLIIGLALEGAFLLFLAATFIYVYFFWGGPSFNFSFNFI